MLLSPRPLEMDVGFWLLPVSEGNPYYMCCLKTQKEKKPLLSEEPNLTSHHGSPLIVSGRKQQCELEFVLQPEKHARVTCLKSWVCVSGAAILHSWSIQILVPVHKVARFICPSGFLWSKGFLEKDTYLQTWCVSQQKCRGKDIFGFHWQHDYIYFPGWNVKID